MADFDPFRVVRCSDCGLAYLCPRPSEQSLQRLYETGDYYASPSSSGYLDYATQESALRATFARVIRTLARHELTGGELLEVGCGFGYLLDEARGWFSRRDGTEIAAVALAVAAQFADEVFRGGLDSVPEGRQYDIVISSQVIEHVFDPHQFLSAQVDRLRPGGTLVVATPHMGSLWRRLLGSRWPSFKVPEHLLYFEVHSLRRLMREVGLVQIQRLPWLHAFPLALIARKLGIAIPRMWGQQNLWIPGTTLAFAGARPRTDQQSVASGRRRACVRGSARDPRAAGANAP